MSAKEAKNKTLLILKKNFPFIEVCLLGAYGFILPVCIFKFIETSDANYIWIFAIVIVISFLFVLFFNNSNKTLRITEKEIVIVKWITRKRIKIAIADLKGYDLRENYERYGVVKHVRIIVSDKVRYEFSRDIYSNYSRLVPVLKQLGIPFLGTVELKSKYKHVISLIVKISSAIAILGFVLVQLMKILR